MSQTVLISGDKGFIGGYLKKTLGASYAIVGLSRSEGYDISDYGSLEKLEESIDMIIHAAAIASNDYESSFYANVVGTLNLCKLAKEKNVKHFVLLSSIFAFDKKENGYFNSYGQTKKISEEIAEAYCRENGIELTILRLAQVYDDARLAQPGQAMLYYFVDTIKAEGKITLFGQKNPLRNYIHIDYLCSIVIEVLAEQKVGTWNVTEERNHTITEIAYMIFDILKKDPAIFRLEDKADIPSVYIPSEDLYKSDICPSIPLEEGIKRILSYDK